MSNALYKSYIKQGKIKEKAGPLKSKCGIWQASSNGAGYPQARINGELYVLHTLMLETKLDRKIKKGMVCGHKCDNQMCLNPTHLEEISVSQNLKDAHNRGLIK